MAEEIAEASLLLQEDEKEPKPGDEHANHDREECAAWKAEGDSKAT